MVEKSLLLVYLQQFNLVNEPLHKEARPSEDWARATRGLKEKKRKGVTFVKFLAQTNTQIYLNHIEKIQANIQTYL